ncbi:unnamed protein product, partial [Ectocarpus sp. 4 AP-2014]
MTPFNPSTASMSMSTIVSACWRANVAATAGVSLVTPHLVQFRFGSLVEQNPRHSGNTTAHMSIVHMMGLSRPLAVYSAFFVTAAVAEPLPKLAYHPGDPLVPP